ncbi:MAG TPA: hypothetical protein VMH40_13805 [Myxococcaceae bacterium]|nr:hypothetical protein [Myxococcaceae bacterium]
MRIHGGVGLCGGLLLVSSAALAQQPEDVPGPPPSLVRQYAVGPRFIIAPGVFIPSSGSAGFALGVEGGYGFDLGPIILTPTISFQGNWSSDWTVYSGLGGARVTLPVGNFGPFVEAGLGYGHVGGPLGYSAGGLAVRGGAGFILFIGRSFAIGISGRYDAIVDTGFKGWTIAPIILLTF